MSAQRQELVASAASTGSSNSSAFAVPTGTMAMVAIDITAITAGGGAFTAWLEGSDDDGTTWYALPADQVMENSAVEAENSVTINDRDICDDAATVSKHVAIYKHLATDKVRLRWHNDATTVTFSASMVTK